MVIIISNKIETKWLLVNSLGFEKINKKVEKYWEARLGLVYIKYCKINPKH